MNSLHSLSSLRMSFVVKSLLLAGIIEYALIRTISRMGILLPAREPVMLIYNAMMFVGSAALNLGSLLVILALALVSYLLIRTSSKLHLTAGTLIIALIVQSLTFLLLTPDGTVSIIYNVISVVLFAIFGIFLFRGGGKMDKGLALIISASFFSSYTFKLLPLLDQVFGISSGSTGILILNLGEALAVAATPVIFLITFRYRREVGQSLFSQNTKAIIISSLLAGVFTSSYLASPWLTSIITVWTLGFTLYMPILVYSIGIWFFFFSILSLPEEKRGFAYGLLLILLSGHLIQLTYLNLLGVLGMFLLARPDSIRSTIAGTLQVLEARADAFR